MPETRPVLGSGPWVATGVALVIVASALTGCSSGGSASAVAGSPAGFVDSSPTSGPSGAIVDPEADAGTSGDPSVDPGTGNATPTPSSTHQPLPKGPTPGSVQPPTVLAASAGSCRPLSGGGREATFSVQLSGGQFWTVLPEYGPTTLADNGSWSIVVDTVGTSPLALKNVKVGGGSPFTTAVLQLPNGPVPATSC